MRIQGEPTITSFLILQDRLFKINSKSTGFSLINKAVIYSTVLVECLARDTKY